MHHRERKGFLVIRVQQPEYTGTWAWRGNKTWNFIGQSSHWSQRELTHEQDEFGLCGSTYMQVVFNNKYYSPTLSTAGWIPTTQKADYEL